MRLFVVAMTGLLGGSADVFIYRRRISEERATHLNRVLRSLRGVDQLITREKDRSLIIQKVRQDLVEYRGFNSAWIALLDKDHQPMEWAHAVLHVRDMK